MGWSHFLNNTEDSEWLLRFPMVKASLRAMDTITDFMKQRFPDENTDLQYYTVAGASKRGWTTWDVGAVDPTRVVGIIPIVLDAINFVQVMHHQYASYNGWSWALSDYTDMDVMAKLDSPEMKKLAQLVDPFYYRDRLTMPKLVVNAALDEFQQPDDTRYWWDDMPEPKHFIMTPNAEHSEATGIFEIVPAIAAWVNQQLESKPVPEFHWTMDESGHCGVTAQGKCMNLKSFWTPKKLKEEKVNGKRTYKAKIDAPDDGRWVAYFIDIVYAKDRKDSLIKFDWEKIPGFIPRDLAHRMQFTTEVSVFPQTFPYPGCGINEGVDTGIPCSTNLV